MSNEDGFEPKEKIQDVEVLKAFDVPERGVRKETLEKFGVKVALSPHDGRTPIAVYFPSHNQKGKVVGYMKQDLTKGKDERGHWTAVGSVSIGNKLFGQSVAEKANRKRSNLTITEGQWDCISVYQAIVDAYKGTKFENVEPLVVSIPMGTANAVEAILHNEPYVLSHDALTIFFDDDHCTPAELRKGVLKGHEAREAVANALVGSSISLFTVTPEEGFKDASDFLQAGRSNDLSKLVQFGRRAYSSEKIVKAIDIDFDDLITPRPEGIYVNCFPKLMEKLHGFRASELVLLTSPSGVGKSTVTSIFASAFMESGEKLGMIYLEETNKEAVQRLIASKLKVNYLEFKNNPLNVAKREDIERCYKEIVENDKLVMLSHFGSLPVSELMAKIKHMHLVEGCRFIILDHLSLVISGSMVKDERKELDIVMTELAAFCAANDVCIIAVSHINRTAADQFKAPKVKEGEEPKPYWVQVTKEMMRGCVDADTEFLSDKGWKKISEYCEGDFVAQYDAEGYVKFVKPEAYIKKPCKEMWHFTTSHGIDMMLSDEHRIAYVTEKDKNTIKFISANDAASDHFTKQTGFRGLIPTTFKTLSEDTLLDEAALRVQIAVNADGWICNHNTGLCRIRVKKDRKKGRIEMLLNEAGIKFHCFNLSDARNEYSFIAPLKKKGVDASWYKLSQEQLEVIVDELFHWDGDSQGRWSSVDKQEADFIQYCLSACGKRSSMSVVEAGTGMLPANDGTGSMKEYKTKEKYVITTAGNELVSFRKAPNAKPSVTRVKTTDGMKYCFGVVSGMFVARRNGKVFVTGNSAALEQLSFIILGLEPEIMPDRSRGRVRLTVLKNRPWGYLGVADSFKIDDESWEVILMEDQEEDVSF